MHKRLSVIRILFFLSLAWGVGLIWISPRPPMIDLPQHAGQVALLHDLVSGTSPWSKVFWINPVTPYLIGYGLALPLSFFMPVGAALQCILSLAYVAFVLLGCRMRARFGADERLDWLMLLPFFGFAYYWGFMTFLTAAPLVILFVLAADRYGRQPAPARGLAVTLLGVLLLLSHGLAFAFGMLVAGLLYAVRCRGHGRPWLWRCVRGAWPFAAPALVCVLYYLVNERIQAHYPPFSNPGMRWNLTVGRLSQLLVNAVGNIANARLLPGLACLLLLAVPWLLGLRPRWRWQRAEDVAPWVLLLVTLAVSTLVPTYMIETAYIYQRFALFALPAYALLFRPAPDARPRAWPMGLMVAAVWSVLAWHALEAWRFARDARDFEPVLAAMKPGQRALALPFARRSEAARLDGVYEHYGVWYQSDRQGLVDFNFAWMQPQIVRYRFDQLPAVREGFRPQSFDARTHRLELYRYILARHTGPLPRDLFKDQACPPAQVMNSGAWTLFERQDCRATGLAAHAREGDRPQKLAEPWR